MWKNADVPRSDVPPWYRHTLVANVAVLPSKGHLDILKSSATLRHAFGHSEELQLRMHYTGRCPPCRHI